MRRLRLRGRRYLLSQKCVEHISPRHEKPFGKWRVRPRRRRLLSLSQHQVSQKMQKRKTHKTGEALNDQIIQVPLSLFLSHSYTRTHTHSHATSSTLSFSLVHASLAFSSCSSTYTYVSLSIFLPVGSFHSSASCFFSLTPNILLPSSIDFY